MEPGDLLGGTGEPTPGTEELRAIVAKSGRRRIRAIGGAAALALVAGGGIGYAVSNHSGGHATVVASSGAAPETGSNAAGSNAAGTSSGASYSVAPSVVAPGGITQVRYTKLFTRTAGDVTVRGFLENRPLDVMIPSCASAIGSTFVAEVSTPGMVGTVFGSSAATATSAISATTAQVLGTSEGDPTGVVLLKTSPAVATVRATFYGGKTDEMAPVGGWSALATSIPAGAYPRFSIVFSKVATVDALSSSGKVLSSQAVKAGSSGVFPALPGGLYQAQPGLACPVRCVPTPYIYQGGAGGSSGSGTAGSGVSSGGSVSSGRSASAGAGAPTVAPNSSGPNLACVSTGVTVTTQPPTTSSVRSSSGSPSG